MDILIRVKMHNEALCISIALIPYGKAWVQPFFLQLWVNRVDRPFNLGLATGLGEGNGS